MNTLRKLLSNYTISEGWGDDDETLEEALRESFTIIHTEPKSSHRWREEHWCVVSIDDDGVTRFFKFSGWSSTNENDAEGCGYYFEGIDKVLEVKPEEYTATRYVSA